jgi:hypothetical protein
MMIVSMLMIFAAPAWSAEVLHSVQCQQGEISDEQLDVIAKLSCGNGTLWETVLFE